MQRCNMQRCNMQRCKCTARLRNAPLCMHWSVLAHPLWLRQ
jgi:hypothetical protein